MVVMLISAGFGYLLAYLVRNFSKPAKMVFGVAVFLCMGALMGALMHDPDPAAIGVRNAIGVFGALCIVGLATCKGERA